MTLVIGLKCSDGIIVGADGAATTVDSMGQYTIRQAHKKLKIIDHSIIVGHSGPVGLGQMIREEITSLWNERGLSHKKSHEAMEIIRGKIWPHVSAALQAASVARPAVGPFALQSALCQTLTALAVSKNPCLFQFDHQCSPEAATEDLTFISIGSGQQIADPFMAFLKRIFWPDHLPNLNMGIFAIYWTLDHAIQTHPGGVADPKQIAVLEQKDGKWRARELDEVELRDHAESAADAEEYLRKYPSTFKNPKVDSPPQPQLPARNQGITNGVK